MSFLEITPAELKKKKEAGKLFLVDVREEYEFEEQNLGGVNIPMPIILSEVAQLEGKSEIVLCCASGKRSKAVAFHLVKQLPNCKIYSLQGGLGAYFNEA